MLLAVPDVTVAGQIAMTMFAIAFVVCVSLASFASPPIPSSTAALPTCPACALLPSISPSTHLPVHSCLLSVRGMLVLARASNVLWKSQLHVRAPGAHSLEAVILCTKRVLDQLVTACRHLYHALLERAFVGGNLTAVGSTGSECGHLLQASRASVGAEAPRQSRPGVGKGGVDRRGAGGEGGGGVGGGLVRGLSVSLSHLSRGACLG